MLEYVGGVSVVVNVSVRLVSLNPSPDHIDRAARVLETLIATATVTSVSFVAGTDIQIVVIVIAALPTPATL